jgi:hypothetical protein
VEAARLFTCIEEPPDNHGYSKYQNRTGNVESIVEASGGVLDERADLRRKSAPIAAMEGFATSGMDLICLKMTNSSHVSTSP